MPATQTADSVQDAREQLRTTLDSVEPIVTMSHEDLVVIALGSKVGRSEADYLTLADSSVQPTPFEFTELDAGGSVPTVQVTVGLHPLVVLATETIAGTSRTA